MSLSDAERLELHELCHTWLDGAATADQRTRLQRWLAESEPARRHYVRTAALSASLLQYAGETQLEEPDLPPLHEIPARGHWWLGAALAAAAALALALWWIGSGTWSNQETELATAAVAEPEETVARLSGAKDCRWEGAPVADELHRGQALRLVSGVAEIAFDSGAVVTVEGPAALDLTSAWETALRYGTLKARVPHEAIGFRVTNPEVEVVDLGTEFSVVAEESGGTEVFVTKGAVETRGGGDAGEPLVLRETEARRFAHARTSEVRDREGKLRRLSRMVALERVASPLGYEHWSFEATPVAERTGLPAPALPATLAGTGSFVGGRFGQALAFAGQTSIHSDLSAFAPGGPRAAAFWLRLPADAQISEASTVLAWNGAGEGMPPVEIGWNREPAHGPVGALLVEAGHGYLVGTTSLRDGQWHHLAFVLRSTRKDGRLQPLLYVDGRLENVSSRRVVLRRDKRAAENAAALVIGGNSSGAAGFRGTLDELYLANRALSPQEIRSLMERNRPASEPDLVSL